MNMPSDKITPRAIESNSQDLNEIVVQLYRDRGPFDRRIRLFACACCRRHIRLLHDNYKRHLLFNMEQLADSGAGVEELRMALRSFQNMRHSSNYRSDFGELSRTFDSLLENLAQWLLIVPADDDGEGFTWSD